MLAIQEDNDISPSVFMKGIHELSASNQISDIEYIFS